MQWVGCGVPILMPQLALSEEGLIGGTGIGCLELGVLPLVVMQPAIEVYVGTSNTGNVIRVPARAPQGIDPGGGLGNGRINAALGQGEWP